MIRWSIVIRTVTLSVCFSSSVAKDSYHIAKLGNLVTISPTEIVDDLAHVSQKRRYICFGSHTLQ